MEIAGRLKTGGEGLKTRALETRAPEIRGKEDRDWQSGPQT
jgi:hypothetical protein